MADGALAGARLPPGEGLAFFRQKLNTPTQHWDDLWQEAHSRGFMVAGAAHAALLTDLRQAGDRAIAGELTVKSFRQEFDAIVAKHGWEHNGAPGWRSNLIYSTNVSMANSAGRYARMTTPEALEMWPYWQYVHNTCQHPRATHLAWDGTILPANDPWFDTHFTPNGWKCHCEIRVVSERMMRRNSWTVSDRPPLNLQPWRNPRTGEIIQVPAGIDPGFAYNPGKAWKEGQAAYVGRPGPSLRAAFPAAEDAGPAHPAVQPAPAVAPVHPGVTPLQAVPRVHVDRARQEGIVRMLNHPVGTVEAGELPDTVRQALGSHTTRVRLSGETMEKQIHKHGDLTADDYRRVPQLLAAPALVAGKGDRRVMILHHDRRLYRAVVKATTDGSENYLLSYHRTTKEKAVRALRGLPIVSGDLDALPDDDTDAEN
jgi:Phage Mu protein F like protein